MGRSEEEEEEEETCQWSKALRRNMAVNCSEIRLPERWVGGWVGGTYMHT